MIAFAAMVDDSAELTHFNELVKTYQEEMMRVARSILHDYQLAEDAVQDAFYGIAVSLKRLPSKKSEAHAYVLSCAKSAALRIQREMCEEGDMGEASTISVYATQDDPTFEAIAESDDYDGLLHAIRQLPEAYQDVMLHYYVYEQSIGEIAKLFGRKPSTVRQQLTRSRRLLAKHFRKEGIEIE